MSKKENSSLYPLVLPVLVALVAGGTAPWWWSELRKSREPSQERTVQTEPYKGQAASSPAPVRCNEPWEWDTDVQSCVRKVTVPRQTFSISPKPSMSQIAGRIDFYVNRERRQGTAGRAMYRENRGALQVVIAVMRGDRLVGSYDDVIFSTDEGGICKVSSLPEATGWLSKMKVGYSLRLETDCKDGPFCQASFAKSGTIVQVSTDELDLTIGKECL